MRQRLVGGFATLLIAAVFISCASTASEGAASIVESDERGVAQCEFLGLVSGTSMLGGAVQERARANAKTHALNAAAAKGATHIVWTDVTSTMSQGASAQGRAYRCR